MKFLNRRKTDGKQSSPLGEMETEIQSWVNYRSRGIIDTEREAKLLAEIILRDFCDLG